MARRSSIARYRPYLSLRLDAAQAGYRVSYEDPWYFSRDYKHRFGEPSMRDAERLRVDTA